MNNKTIIVSTMNRKCKIQKVTFAFTIGFIVFGLLTSGCKHAKTGVLIVAGPDGTSTNTGTLESPVDFATALQLASIQLKEKGLPKGGLRIELLDGIYRITDPYKLEKEFCGTQKNPIIIQPAPRANVIFDGRANVLNPEGFERVTKAEEQARLAGTVKDKILVKTIKDPAIIEVLSSKVVLNLSFNEALYLPSVYPNSGYANLNTKPFVNESFPPGIPKAKQRGGARAGHPPFRDMSKPAGWRGSMEDPRGAQAGIVNREDEMAGTWSQWAAELEHNNTRHDFTGYYEAIWKLSSMKIHSVNAKTKTMRFAEAFSYGFGWLKSQPFKVYGLLCELDQPGEWYFDTQTSQLYIYPTEEITETTRIGLPVAKGFLHLKNTEHVHIIGIHVRNVGKGNVINIEGGEHNLLAGATISSSTATGVLISGIHNGMRGCDLIDLNQHVVLDGGLRSATEITAGENYVENCHFYQKNFTHEKVNIVMKGVGNRFRHNLVHNSIGEVMRMYGNDQLVELNEFFNIGYEEGDGGVIYSGADMAGYGNVYQHNFIHHLMRTPNKKYGRSAIYLDDHQAGGTCIGNIFYKACDVGVYINSGAGNTAIGNLFLETKYGAFVRGNWGKKAHRIMSEIAKNPKHDYVGMKEDFVGRIESEIGKEAWLHEPWANKYPLFKKVMSDSGVLGRAWPIYTTITNNMYYGNIQDSTMLKAFPEGLREKITLENDIQIDPSYFKDYDNMDFTFVKTIDEIEAIPFEKIGLYLDEYRKEMPNKKHYRSTIKKCFEGMPAYEETAKRINTSKVVEGSVEFWEATSTKSE